MWQGSSYDSKVLSLEMWAMHGHNSLLLYDGVFIRAQVLCRPRCESRGRRSLLG